MTISTKGGFFLIGGVMLFFDRAMLVSPLATYEKVLKMLTTQI